MCNLLLSSLIFMGPSFWQILIILFIILIIFGAGKLPSVMHDLGKGLKNFRDGMKEDDKNGANDEKNLEK